MKKLPFLFVATALLLTSTANHARASAITYTITGLGTGTLNGTSFDTTITLTGIGDTANITYNSNFPATYTNRVSGTVTIPGLGTATFTNSSFAATANAYGYFGFVDSTPLFEIYNHSAFSTYNLATAIAPATGFGLTTTNSQYATDMGEFILIGLSSPSGGASAAAPVPEISSYGPVALALALGCMVLRRRQTMV